jgi:hypothetical protein
MTGPKTKTMTSIEWLENELLNKMNGTPIVDKLLFDQAKEMHKQEIIDAHFVGFKNFVDTKEISEEYYQEKYNQNK